MSAVDVQQSSAVPGPAATTAITAFSPPPTAATAVAAPATATAATAPSARRPELAIRFGDATKDNWQQVTRSLRPASQPHCPPSTARDATD